MHKLLLPRRKFIKTATAGFITLAVPSIIRLAEAANNMPLLGVGGAAASGGGPTTFNPADKSAGVTLTNGNLTYTGSGGSRVIKGLSTGKGYWETTVIQASGDTAWNIGIAIAASAFATIAGTGDIMFLFVGSGSGSNGNPGTGAALGATDIACHAVDFGAKLYWVRKNGGNWNNSGANDPATGVGGTSFSGATAPFFACCCSNAVGTSYTINLGASTFSFTIPSGFSSYNAL